MPPTTPSPHRRAWHPTHLLWLLAAWLGTVGNIPLWLNLWNLSGAQTARALWGTLALVGVLVLFTVAVLGVLVWPRWLKPVGLLLLLVVTSSSYFMMTYGIVIDPTMLVNTLNTDTREALDLLSWKMAPALLLGVGLPGWWLWRQPLRPVALKALLKWQLGGSLLALLACVVLLWLSFQDLASTMRNNKSLRYTINPYNTLYALVKVGVGGAAQAQQPLQPIGADATLRHPPASPEQAPLVVLVVGETARAANFGLAGYSRDTTPGLKQLQAQGEVVYYPNVTSCGTNTQVSVPCMFSHLDREAYTNTNARYESALDVLQRAGLAVLWLDNQSGCKGVCDRVPNADTRALTHTEHCTGGECLDKAMLAELPRQLALLDAQRRAKGTVVVMHQMGNHGPAYYKRSPPAQKPFQPECATNVLQDCAPAHIVNAYDNAIRYTDSFLSDTIAWLKTQNRPTALVYVSDHGESLGEKGLYLHGMPFGMAPREQTHVPMVTWLGGAWRGAMGCVRQRSEPALSHDNYFHTVLGLAGVSSREYQPAMDLLGPCVHPNN